MDNLSKTLLAAQMDAPLGRVRVPPTYPIFRTRIHQYIGGERRYDWQLIIEYVGEYYFHAATMPTDGSLLRLKVSDPEHVLWFQRVEDTEDIPSFLDWDNWNVPSYAVSICSYGSAVFVFRIDASDGHLYRRESSDNGASWGSWIDMGDVTGTEDFRLASCFKDADEAIVLYSCKDTRQEYYIEGADTDSYVHGVTWYSQTFTPANAHTIAWLKLKLSRTGSPGTVTVSIRATDGNGHPTGPDLTSGTLNGNTLTTSSSGGWYAIHLTPYALSASIKYAIVVRAPSGDGSNKVNWLGDWSSPTYAGGNFEWSGDSGSTWNTESGRDFMFEDWESGGSGTHSNIHTRRWISSSWESANVWTNLLASITGISVFYMGDWNVAVTGIDGDSQDGIWTTVYGDGYSQSVGNWYTLNDLIVRESTESFQYSFPSSCMPAVFRLFFVEHHTQATTQDRIYFTHGLSTADYISNLWREPVPFREEAAYGAAICYKSPYIWLCTSDRVWRAEISPSYQDISDDVISIDHWTQPDKYKGKMRIVLDNTAGTYNNFDRLGQMLRVSFGYHTTEGDEYASADGAWITGWEFESPPWYPLRAMWPAGVQGTLNIFCDDIWELLKRWKARREFHWEAGEQNIYQLMARIFAKVGIELSAYSTSSACVNFYPEFTIRQGYNGKWAIKKLLSYVPDVIHMVRDTAYITDPRVTDSNPYSMNPEVKMHVVLDTWMSLQYPFIDPETVVVKDCSGTPTYTWGVDYLIDYLTGRIYCRSAGNIGEDDTIHVFYEAAKYTYHSVFFTKHLLYRGHYGTHAWDPNRAQVVGDTFMADEFDWDQIELMYDRLSYVTKPEYPNIARATERAEAELRKGEVYEAESGWCITPWNVGLHPFDIVRLTDIAGGIDDRPFRVLGIRTRYDKRHWMQMQTLRLGAV